MLFGMSFIEISPGLSWTSEGARFANLSPYFPTTVLTP
jgi:hypothetical protein